MNDGFWIDLVCYLGMWLIAGYFFWRAYRIGIKKDLRLVKDARGKCLPNRRGLAKPYAITELLTAISVAALLTAIPLLAIPMKIWPAFMLVIGTSRQLQLLKFSRNNGS